MSSDRRLLELAAKAAGYEVHDWMPGCGMALNDRSCINGVRRWNPFAIDGDAMGLAVKLRMKLRISDYGAAARLEDGDAWSGCESHLHGGIEAATRRAIVRAAAEIGMALP